MQIETKYLIDYKRKLIFIDLEIAIRVFNTVISRIIHLLFNFLLQIHTNTAAVAQW